MNIHFPSRNYGDTDNPVLPLPVVTVDEAELKQRVQQEDKAARCRTTQFCEVLSPVFPAAFLSTAPFFCELHHGPDKYS